jgi:hypothetical protein
MLEATKIAEVKGKGQPVLMEEVIQLKCVVIRSQHISLTWIKAELLALPFPFFI